MVMKNIIFLFTFFLGSFAYETTAQNANGGLIACGNIVIITYGHETIKFQFSYGDSKWEAVKFTPSSGSERTLKCLMRDAKSYLPIFIKNYEKGCPDDTFQLEGGHMYEFQTNQQGCLDITKRR